MAKKLPVNEALFIEGHGIEGDAPESLVPGTRAKIMIDVPMPEGADTVVPIEDVKKGELVIPI